MSKNQKKNLNWCMQTFKPESIYDIPPTFWGRIGANTINFDKINFIIHIKYRLHYEKN